MPTSRPTMADVARLAGVSRSTVSFVLNDVQGQSIPEATRTKVTAAAHELGYRPHALARALREGAARIVVLDTGNMPHLGVLEGFVEGLSAGVEEADHHLLISPFGAARSTSRAAIEAVRPAGVITLQELHLGPSSPTTLEVAAEMTGHLRTPLMHLAAAGHTGVAFVYPGESETAFMDRMLEHAREAAEGAGLRVLTTLPQSRIPAGPPASGATATGLIELLNGATAVLGLSDTCALAVLAAAADAGIAVPERLSVIGFGGSPEAALWRPRLTSSTIDAAAFGRRAASRVLGLDPAPLPERLSWILPGETVGRPSR
ncbi:MAG: LacI family transcriptional regulator [Arthrobacter sp.]|nr:LacI family transcriptional regulator [Arthrobacter sp.]